MKLIGSYKILHTRSMLELRYCFIFIFICTFSWFKLFFIGLIFHRKKHLLASISFNNYSMWLKQQRTMHEKIWKSMTLFIIWAKGGKIKLESQLWIDHKFMKSLNQEMIIFVSAYLLSIHYYFFNPKFAPIHYY